MSIPKEPRQLMINLMYLVLTALLALNVSNEILNAFKTLSSSLNKSNQAIDQRTNELYAQIKENELKPGQAEKVKPFREKADIVVKRSDEFVAFFENWKKRIIARAGGPDKADPTIPERGDDIDATTALLVEKKGGDTIKEKLNDFRSFLLSMLTPKDAEAVKPLMPVQAEPVKKGDNNPKGDWSMGYFQHMPSIAAMALFAKFQNDIRASEALVVKSLYDEAHLHDIKIDTIGAIAVPRQTYALVGDKIEASILMAAYNKASKPTVTITQGGGTKKDAVGGIVPWETVAAGTGVQTVKGKIALQTENETITRDWQFEYVVGTTGAAMQFTKMNVFYIGVPNPVTISAAGYSIEDVYLVLPDGSGAKMEGEKGSYNIWVTKPTAKDNPMMIDIYAKSKDPKGAPSKISSVAVRCKNIPDPVAVVNGFHEGNMKVGQFRIQVAPVAMLKDFDFEAKFVITSFTFSALTKTGEYFGPFTVNSTTGARFTDNGEIGKTMAKLKSGDKVFIEGIKGRGPDNVMRPLLSCFFTMTN
jgi:gliding motility-associated protein GldM